MSYESRFMAKVLSACGAAAVGLCVGAYFLDRSYCESNWRTSGMRTEYRRGVCMLEVKPGKWIPEERYREIP